MKEQENLEQEYFDENQYEIENRIQNLYWTVSGNYGENIKLDTVSFSRSPWVAESKEAGVFLCMAMGGRQIFVMGHPEYDRVTLDGEYKRDKSKGLEIEIPANYYPENDPDLRPRLLWRAHANNLYTNWLNYYVYQCTPYDLEGTPF